MAMIPACRTGESMAHEYWTPAGAVLKQEGAEPICTGPRSTGVELSTPVNIHAYKDGSATVSFACDASEMEKVSRDSANGWLVVTAGKAAVQKIRLLDRPGSMAACSIAGLDIDEALDFCIDLSEALEVDPSQCASRCVDNPKGWVCVADS